MGPLPTQRRAVDVRTVTVRPTFGAQEHRHWDRLVAAHHYLGFGGLFGKGLRHVATLGSTWVWVRDLPRNLACLTNAAISIIRCQPEFRWVPEANRHYAGRPQEALDLLLAPPQS